MSGVTIVGPRQDALATALFHEALRCPVTFKRVERWDPRDGPLPNPDVEYPPMKTAAAFVCTANTCSAPIADPRVLARKLSGVE